VLLLGNLSLRALENRCQGLILVKSSDQADMQIDVNGDRSNNGSNVIGRQHDREEEAMIRFNFVVPTLVATSIACAAIGPIPVLAQSSGPSTSLSSAPVAKSLMVGDSVQSVSGGSVMTVRSIDGGQALCDWADADGKKHSARFPIKDLVASSTDDKLPAMNEPQPYKPCPANVITAQGKHECLND
jgi:uncharacterized protein YodC (DUF2158 family)